MFSHDTIEFITKNKTFSTENVTFISIYKSCVIWLIANTIHNNSKINGYEESTWHVPDLYLFSFRYIHVQVQGTSCSRDAGTGTGTSTAKLVPRYRYRFKYLAPTLIRTLGTNFSKILSENHIFSFKKMHLKISSGKFCLGLNVLRTQTRTL